MMKRGIILAGGKGTRLSPFTDCLNKHLAPVYTRSGAIPLLNYPINTLKSLGATDILVITSQEHCGSIVDYLGDGYDRGLNFTYKIQETNDPERPLGIASALKLCEDFTQQDPFIVILGDNYYQWNNKFLQFYDAFIDQYENSSLDPTLCGLFLQNRAYDWSRFGVAEFNEAEEIIRIVEKPKKFVSDMVVTGMYIYTPHVYEVAKTLKPSNRGELEISDINNYYTSNKSVNYVKFKSFWSDMGTPESLIKTQEFINGN